MHKIHDTGNNLCLLKVSNDGKFLIEMASEFHICGAAMKKVRFEAVWRLRIVLCSNNLVVSEAKQRPGQAGSKSAASRDVSSRGLWGPRPSGVTKGVPKMKGKEEREKEKENNKGKKKGGRTKKRQDKKIYQYNESAPFRSGFKVNAGGAPPPFLEIGVCLLLVWCSQGLRYGGYCTRFNSN